MLTVAFTAEPTESPSPANGGGEDSNYLIVSIAVGIPCGAIILALVLAIFVMFYLTCKTSRLLEQPFGALSVLANTISLTTKFSTMLAYTHTPQYL